MKVLLIIFLTSLSFPALAGPCESTAFGSAYKPFESASFKQAGLLAGVETYQSALRRDIKRLLNRDINPREEEAIEQANQTGRAEDSKKSEWILIREKAGILQKAGFSKQEIRLLMESGIVWIRNLTAEEALIKSLKVGEKDRYFIFGQKLFSIKDREIARINQVIAESNENFKVEVESLESPRSPYIKSIPKTTYFLPFELIHPDTQIIFDLIHPNTHILFESAKLEIKKVNREDLELSPPTQKAEELQQQGYGPAWTKGIDKLNEWVEVRRQLQDLRANPCTTHISYFADQIKDHLAFAKQKLGAMSQKQKTQLSNLEIKAKQAILNETVTYEWWVDFNFQLSAVLTYESGLEINRPSIKKIISQFPLRMVIPTTEGEVGIITLNRAQSEGIYPLGLVNEPTKDGREILNPHSFMLHDLQHAFVQYFDLAIKQYSNGHRLRHKKMQALMENLSKENRKRAELIYFLSTHETELDILLSQRSREEIAIYLASKFRSSLPNGIFSKKMAGLGTEYSNISVVRIMDRMQYIRDHIIEYFMREVFDPAFGPGPEKPSLFPPDPGG